MVCANHEWIELDEIYALTSIKKEENGNITFLPSIGIPLTVEVCKNCGEIKLFSAKLKGKFQ